MNLTVVYVMMDSSVTGRRYVIPDLDVYGVILLIVMIIIPVPWTYVMRFLIDVSMK